MKYTPTDAIRNNSLKGSALLEKHGTKKSLDIKKKLQSTIDAIKGDLTYEEVSEIYHELSALSKRFNPKTVLKGYNLTSETAAFLSLGGNAAMQWSFDIIAGNNNSSDYNTEEQIPDSIQIQVTKSLNEELKQATYVVMVPDEVDLHGDITDEIEVAKACHSFNAHCRKSNLFHISNTNTFDIVESYIAPVDFSLGGRFVKKGTWLCTVQVHDDDLWQLMKSGDICSVSIGAIAKVENIED